MSDPYDPNQGAGGFPNPGGGAVPPPPPGGAVPPAPPAGPPPAPTPPPGGGYAAPAPPPGGGYSPPPPGGGYAPAPPPGGGGPGGFNVPNSGAAPVFIPELGANLADPVPRLIARVIDGLIVGVVNSIIGFALVSAMATDTTKTGLFGVPYTVSETPFYGYLVAGLISAGVAFAYEFFLTQMQGATIGKKVMGCQIRRADGQPLDAQTMLIRCGIIAVPSLLQFALTTAVLGGVLGLLIWVGSLVLVFTDPRRESVMDKAAKTLVITTK